MKQSLEEAEQELKRVDHLIYVSLKYTRTVDIIKNTLNRIIDAYDAGIKALLKLLHEVGQIESVPKSPGLRVNILMEQFDGEPVFLDFFEHYRIIREILRSDFSKREEFRRHVTMISQVRGQTLEVNIDSVTEDYKKVKTFVKLVSSYIENNGEGDLKELLDKVLLELELDRRYY